MTENKNAKTPTDGPVAWGCQCGRAYTVTCIASKPLKREWVGLTDEEKSDLWCESTGRDWVNEDTHVFADAIEAKLREKNHG